MINNVNPNNKSFSPLLRQRLTKTAPVKDIKPDVALGKLVPNRPLVADFAISIKDTFKDAMNLADAIKTGNTNDHELGRMNDLGLKVGGLAIASYLATKRFTKTSKAMEFVGLGAFIASMALWPRLFIDTPTRLIHGFNPSQKFEDSQGRKKKFFQDNQYLPWDIWDKKDINKIADKMGVDKNLAEREEYTKKKMQKIALQDNTLWMLTAGFATPIMTSLICDGVQPYIEKENTKRIFNKSQKNLDNIDSLAQVKAEKAKNFIDILGKDFDKASRSDVIDYVARAFNPERVFDGADEDSKRIIKNFVNMQDIVKKDITAILTPSMIDDDKCELFAKNLLALAPEGEFDEKVVVSLVKKANEGNGSFINKFKEIIADSDYWELNDDKYISFVKKALEGKEYTTVFDNTAKRNLEEQYNSVIKPLFARLGILQESINSTFGRRTESLSTLTYKDVSNKIIKGLNLSSAEIARSKDNLEEAMNIAIEKLATKAKNPDEFMSYLASVATEQNKYSEKITSSLLKIQGKGFDTVFEDGVGSIEDGAFKNVMDFVQNLGDDFKHTKSFFTLGGNRNSLIAHFKNTIDKALANTDACFARFILASDFERRCASDKAFVEKLVSLAPDSFEDKEKTVISWCRKILLDDTMTDFSNKNNIPFKKLYDGLMESLFDPEKLTDETKKVLKDNNLLDRVKKSILNMKDVALNLKSREFDYLGGNARYMVSQGLQYNMMGKPISELFQESSKQLFNNKKWFKIFAPAFGVLAGVTVLSQFFFGKMKDEHLYKKQEGVNNVSGK